jgi:hypothetical protein
MMMAEDAAPLVGALVAMRRGPICRRTCSRRSTIRELSPRSPLMVTRWRGLRSARHHVGGRSLS